MSQILKTSEEFSIYASPLIAKELGTPAAIFIQKLHYLINNSKNKNGKKSDFLKVHQNRKWWWHTFENWQKTLGLYSVSTIKRAVAKLSELGLI